jgi:NADPH:quinone reductase-like Zn-dependent oxidoreductase
MRAVRLHEFGGPANLRLEEVAVPEPGAGQVLVRVAAAGVNPIDAILRRGERPGLTLPMGLGGEASGTVERVGPGVEEFRAGQQVCGLAVGGGYAEYALLDAARTLPIPAGVDPIAAGGLPIVLRTAWHGVVTLGALQPGEWLLVHGAGGGVGSLAVQIGAALGGRVIATGRDPRKLDAARALGAEATVDYGPSDWPATVQRLSGGVNVVADGVGASTFAGTLECLALNARWAIYGAISGGDVPANFWALIARCATLMAYSTSVAGRMDETQRDLARRALPLFAAGKLRAPATERLALADAVAAHKRLASRDVVGRLVLVP